MDDMLTITLTGRKPVRIRKADWPIMGQVEWGNQRERALVNDWNRHWRLVARQHADGRAIVYGVYETRWLTEENRRVGELLAAGDDVAAALVRVGRDLGAPDEAIVQAIADLPAEELD